MTYLAVIALFVLTSAVWSSYAFFTTENITIFTLAAFNRIFFAVFGGSKRAITSAGRLAWWHPGVEAHIFAAFRSFVTKKHGRNCKIIELGMIKRLIFQHRHFKVIVTWMTTNDFSSYWSERESACGRVKQCMTPD